jgi:hypothetical protein
MTEKRDSPYAWVTWITKLLSGEAHCEWAAWFRSHYAQFEKRPSNFDFAKWSAEHAQKVRERASALQKEAFSVTIEDQNKFGLRGNSGALLGGKPDIIAIKGSDVLVLDCKTGQPRGADYFQVLIYMLALPFVRPQFRGKRITGQVDYSDQSLRIGPDDVTEEITSRIWALLEHIGGPNELTQVPSPDECAFCDITRSDCPVRIDESLENQQEEGLAPF